MSTRIEGIQYAKLVKRWASIWCICKQNACESIEELMDKFTSCHSQTNKALIIDEHKQLFMIDTFMTGLLTITCHKKTAFIIIWRLSGQTFQNNTNRPNVISSRIHIFYIICISTNQYKSCLAWKKWTWTLIIYHVILFKQ